MPAKTVDDVRREISVLLGQASVEVNDDSLLHSPAYKQSVACTLCVHNSDLTKVAKKLLPKSTGVNENSNNNNNNNDADEVALMIMLRELITLGNEKTTVFIPMPVAIGVLLAHKFNEKLTRKEAGSYLAAYGIVDATEERGIMIMNLVYHNDSYFQEVNQYVSLLLENKPLGPLCDNINDTRVRSLFSYVLSREAFTSGSTWKVGLPDYWVVPEGSVLTQRAAKPVFKDLVCRGTAVDAAAVNMREKVLVLSGDSGSGKTCALLAAGMVHSKGKGLHIVVTRTSLLEHVPVGQLGEIEVAAAVRQYVYEMIQPALSITTNNTKDGNVVDVYLHVDEAGLDPSLPAVTSPKPHAMLRTLIKAAHYTLRNEHFHESKVRMRIYVAVAGTGIDEMYKGGGGSIHELIEKVTTQRFDRDILHQLSMGYLASCSDPRGATDALLAQGATAVVATNARLFRFTLEHLAVVLESLNPVPKDEQMRSSRMRSVTGLYSPNTPQSNTVIRQTQRNRGLILPDIASLVVSFLPDACKQGAAEFIRASGLYDMPLLYRECVLRVAHAAHIVRAVLVRDNEWDALHRPLTEAGFAPLRYSPGSPTTKLLEEGLCAGVWTSTRREASLRKLDGLVRVSVVGENSVVAIPKSQPPVALSTAYRLLHRLLGGTLFIDADWRTHEGVMVEVIREALDTLGTVCGGCLRQELHCAVLGASYGLEPPTLPVSAAATSGQPSAAGCHDASAPAVAHEPDLTWVSSGSDSYSPLQKRRRTERSSLLDRVFPQKHKKKAPPVEPVVAGRCKLDELGARADAFRFDYCIKVNLSHALHLRSDGDAKRLCARVAVDCGKALLNRLESERSVAARLERCSVTCPPTTFDTRIQLLRAAVDKLETALEAAGNNFSWAVKRAMALLRPHIAHTMFVLVPPERSASADAVLLCVGSEAGPGYFGAMQWKAWERTSSLGRTVTYTELRKVGLEDVINELKKLWVTKGKKNEGEAVKSVVNELKKQCETTGKKNEGDAVNSVVPIAVRQELEALASCGEYPVKLSDFYFGLTNTQCLTKDLLSNLSITALDAHSRRVLVV